jgi:hypothetical protein
MVSLMERDTDSAEPDSVEFFGVKLKVNNPHLAALLNSSVTEDVQVIGGRARSAFAADSHSQTEDAHPDPPEAEVTDGSVDIRLDEDET